MRRTAWSVRTRSLKQKTCRRRHVTHRNSNRRQQNIPEDEYGAGDGEAERRKGVRNAHTPRANENERTRMRERENETGREGGRGDKEITRETVRRRTSAARIGRRAGTTARRVRRMPRRCRECPSHASTAAADRPAPCRASTPQGQGTTPAAAAASEPATESARIRLLECQGTA
jgi:hypothetical protein